MLHVYEYVQVVRLLIVIFLVTLCKTSPWLLYPLLDPEKVHHGWGCPNRLEKGMLSKFRGQKKLAEILGLYG